MTEIAPLNEMSLPVRGAWIEMTVYNKWFCRFQSLPVRGAWIEITDDGRTRHRQDVSLPVRGAWIEILKGLIGNFWLSMVAPRAGSVE